MRWPAMIVIALLAAGCASDGREASPAGDGSSAHGGASGGTTSPGTAAPGSSPAPGTAAPGSTPAPATLAPSPCPVSSARSGDALNLGGGRTVTVVERPLTLVTGGSRRELPGRRVDELALACATDGRVALGWIDHDDTQRVRLALGERVVTLGRSKGFDELNPGFSGLALAFEPDGELLVAFADLGRVRAVTVSPNGDVGRTVTLGAAIQYSNVVAEITPNGRAIVAWATEDAGIEFNERSRVFLATRDDGRLFGPARRVHVSTAVDPEEGSPLRLALGAADNGRAALLFGDVTGSYKRGGFRHPVMIASADGSPRRLARDGEPRDVAIRADGQFLAVWVARRRLWAQVGDSPPQDLGPAEPARATFEADGRATVTTASGRVLHPT